jgi:hypothetical protein
LIEGWFKTGYKTAISRLEKKGRNSCAVRPVDKLITNYIENIGIKNISYRKITVFMFEKKIIVRPVYWFESLS